MVTGGMLGLARADPPETDRECLLLLLAEVCREVLRSGITATLMTSCFDQAGLDPQLSDLLEISEPALQRYSLLSFCFLCTSRWDESEVDCSEALFDSGMGALVDLRESFLTTFRNVPLFRGLTGDSTTYASMADGFE